MLEAARPASGSWHDLVIKNNRMKQRQVSDEALKDVLDVMNTVAEYFTAAVVYLREQGITTARTR